MARSINSPGVQIIETDISNYQQIVGGTTVYVPGFAPQGPVDETLLITSVSELEQVYGTPQTAAERYFYHSAKQILNSPATLLTTRLPYGSGMGEGFADQYSALLFPIISSGDTFSIGTPIHKTLTDDEYTQLTQGDFVWAPIIDTPVEPTYTNKILDSGFIVINDSQTAANELFEGYYVSVTDNSEWGAGSNFTAITNFYGLTSTSGFYDIPEGRLNLALSGTNDLAGSNSISELIERRYDYAINQPYYNDSVVVNVYRVRRSIYEPYNLTVSIVESHLGSFDSNKKESAQNAGLKTFFLENVINNTSRNIKMFVNPDISQNTIWTSLSSDEPSKNVRVDSVTKAVFPTSVFAPTYNRNITKEVGNVRNKVKRALTLVESTESVAIDVIIDAGLSTIAANTAENIEGQKVFNESKFQPAGSSINTTSGQVLAYKSVLNTFNNFAQNVRQDCVFIADPLRQIFVNGDNSKILDVKTNTFTQNIFNPLKVTIETLNSNYSVIYGNWARAYDSFTDKNVWLPFSGFAAAAYARTDTFAQPWIAPAGLTRGIIPGVLDLAFNPNQKQRDFLYTISVNPVVFFSGDGYAIFGQKTMQTKPSAFDRVNVRRLFLVLERATQRALKYFVFEPNTEFTRTRLKNTITPIFELAKNTQGLYDYLIICDERNNTPDIIDRNELLVDIYIKPVKAAEFILVNFIATRTGQNFQELI
jgi:phage tail sheath protein FI